MITKNRTVCPPNSRTKFYKNCYAIALYDKNEYLFDIEVNELFPSKVDRDAFTFFYFVGLRFAYEELLGSINGA